MSNTILGSFFPYKSSHPKNCGRSRFSTSYWQQIANQFMCSILSFWRRGIHYIIRPRTANMRWNFISYWICCPSLGSSWKRRLGLTLASWQRQDIWYLECKLSKTSLGRNSQLGSRIYAMKRYVARVWVFLGVHFASTITILRPQIVTQFP